MHKKMCSAESVQEQRYVHVPLHVVPEASAKGGVDKYVQSTRPLVFHNATSRCFVSIAPSRKNQGCQSALNKMASPRDTKTDDLEAGLGQLSSGEKFGLEEAASPSGGLLAQPPDREDGPTKAPPGRETDRLSLLFWIAVNTLATIAIVCRPLPVSYPRAPSNF